MVVVVDWDTEIVGESALLLWVATSHYEVACLMP